MDVSVGSILSGVSRRQLRHRRGVVLVWHLVIWCVLFGLACGIEYVHSLPERVWGLFQLGVIGGCVISYGLWYWLFLPRRFSAFSVARAIEARHPELRDSLNCGLELESRESLNELEAAVVGRVRSQLGADGGSYVAELKRDLCGGRLCLILAALAGCLGGLQVSRGGQKARCWLSDRLRGADSGLTILAPSPGAWFTTHSDVRIRVRVNRWEREPLLHSIDETGGEVSFPMHVEACGEAVGVLYDVVDRVRYRVTTPSLSSSWREHGVCDRPVLKSVSLRTVPQAHTGLEAQHYSDLRDVGIVSGDRLVLEVSCVGGSHLRLLHGAFSGFLRERGDLQRIEFGSEETGDEWILVADDVQGQEHELGRFQVTVTPDRAPEIERLEPAGDVSIHDRDSVRLHAIARDDFGLRSFALRYRVAGREGQELSLASEDAEGRECEWNDLWDVSALKLTAGDVVTCVLVARDNRPPHGQEARSEVFFVSIVPDLKDIKADGQSGKEETQVDLSDLVVESKRLLRLTYDLLDYDQPPQAGLNDLLGGLGDLQLEIGRREMAILKKAGVPSMPEPLKGLFAAAKERLGVALESVRGDELRGSLAYQEQSLGALSRLVAEMMKNKAKSDKAKEGKESGKGSSEEGQEKQKGDQQPQDESKGESSKALSEAVAQLRQLISSQDVLNRLYGRGSGSALGELSQEQRRIRHRTRALEQSLVDYELAQVARQELSGAIGEMSGAERGLQGGDLSSSHLRGLRAVQGLRDALASLERAQRESNRRQVEALSRALSELSRRQAAASQVSRALSAQKSRGEDDGSGRESARQEQESLRRETESLRSQVSRSASSLESSSPEGAEGLRELSRALGSESISAGQRKALNGLLYRRYDRAAREQSKVGEELSRLSRRLSEISSKLPSYSGSELRRHLDRLESDLRAVKSAQGRGEGAEGQSALSAARRESGRDIRSLGKLLGDRGLEESGELTGSGEGSGSSVSEGGDRVLRHLRHAIEVGAQRLSELERENQLRFHREQVYPPDKYRRLVEDYFKSLAE